MDIPADFTLLDRYARLEHSNLPRGDQIWYLGDYSSGKSWDYSVANKFIKNLKKKPSSAAQPGYHYKNRAISLAVVRLRNALPAIIDFDEDALLVPVPPSKIRGHVDFDPRMTTIANSVAARVGGIEFAELVVQTIDMDAAHENQVRPTVDQLIEAYSINFDAITIVPDHVYILDDVLTAGNHYAAMRHVIRECFGNDVVTTGIFLTRTVRPNPFEAL